MGTAKLQCVELWNKETQTLPKFNLSYADKSWEFRAYHMGDAGQQARFILDELVFGNRDQVWFPGINDRRIHYEWIKTLDIPRKSGIISPYD
jgi:hypothetical protein